MTIPVGTIGRIISGSERGQYVKVQEDADNTGGYLILVSSDLYFTSGGDYWVEKEEMLAKFFEELGGVVWSIAR
jgi:hypothetical protein